MPRFTPLDQRHVSSEQRRVLDEVRHGRRQTVPANVAAWIDSPELARRAARLGEWVRYQTSLEPKHSELAILAVARRWSCAYEWAVHVGEATAAGVASEVIAAIGAGDAAPADDPAEAAVFAFAAELAATGRVSDERYEGIRVLLGEAGVTDLIAVVGYYTFVAFTLNARQVPAPTDGPQLPAGP